MPPAKDGCKFDESQWRDRIEDRLWHSDDSFSKQLEDLRKEIAILKEQRAADKKIQDELRQFVRAYLPGLVTLLVAGVLSVFYVGLKHFLK